jgi:neuralized-like protein 4
MINGSNHKHKSIENSNLLINCSQHHVSNQQWWPVVELYGSTVGITVISSFTHYPAINQKVAAGSTSSIPRYVVPGAATSPGCASNSSLVIPSNLHSGNTYTSNRIFGGISNFDVQHMQDSLEVVLEQNENEGNQEEQYKFGGHKYLDEESGRNVKSKHDSKVEPLMFHENHGRNVILKKHTSRISEDANALETPETTLKSIAVRTDSYNQGIALTSRPLDRGELFQVMVDKLNSRWSSTLSIGVLGIKREIGICPDEIESNGLMSIHLPITAVGFKKYSRVISGDGGYYENGKRLASSTSDNQEDKKKNDVRAPPNLEKLVTSPGHTVGVMIDFEEQLHIYVDGEDHGIVGPIVTDRKEGVPIKPRTQNICYYGLIDLYGQCEQVSIVDNLATNKNCVADSCIGESKKKDADEEILSKRSQGEGVNNDQLPRSPEFSSTFLVTHSYIYRNFSRPSDNCAYLRLCQKFWISLALPENYFIQIDGREGPTHNAVNSHIKSICYCPSCYRSSSSNTTEIQNPTSNVSNRAYDKGGVPPKDYALPLGWVSFPLQQINSQRNHRKQRTSGDKPKPNQRTTNENENSSMNANDSENVENRETNKNGGDWHVAYHGSRAAFLRKMLDNGELTPTCELGLDGGGRSSRKPKASKEDDSDATPLLFSPTLRYVGDSEILCPSVNFKDNTLVTNRKQSQTQIPFYGFKAKVAFQLEVHPGSYKVGPPTSKMQDTDQSPLTKPPDTHFKLDETEWLTKERGNTAITALLIQLQLLNNST